MERIDRECAVESAKRFLAAAHLEQSGGMIAEGLDKIRPHRHRPFETGQSVRIALHVGQSHTAHAQPIEIEGIEF